MKKVYWRPRAVSRSALILIAGQALVGLLLVESMHVTRERPYSAEKLAAATLAEKGIQCVTAARERLGPKICEQTDPTLSGLIGLPMSSVTSISGDLTAKQTSVNPNFAAVIVDMLKTAGVAEGDVVAVACSGSFPALNICVYAALETLQARPVVISSAAASQWGANVPELLWLDMERILTEQQVFSTRSIAASLGGYEDLALGLSDEGCQALDEGIRRNQLTKLLANTFEENVQRRMEIYRQQAKGKPIKAYINVGGGTVSVGRARGKRLFKPGLNQRPPGRMAGVDGVMPRFASQGVPVLHLVQVVQLAEQYGLPAPPSTMPEIGSGSAVFYASEYNKWLATAVLGLQVTMLYGFIRSDVGFRLLRFAPKPKEQGYPVPMV